MKHAVVAAAAVAVLAGGLVAAGTVTPAPTPTSQVVVQPTGVRPIAAFTPGVVDRRVTPANVQRTICKPGYTATVRPSNSVMARIERQQIAQYDYADSRPERYEEDHLISLELGGAPSDPRNLWPEPYDVLDVAGRPAGARVKDQLENRLHRQVCAGQMDLRTAQRLEAQDWYTAYKEIFG